MIQVTELFASFAIIFTGLHRGCCDEEKQNTGREFLHRESARW